MSSSQLNGTQQQVDVQEFNNFLTAALINPVAHAARIASSIYNFTAQELNLHRQFEKHMREGTVTEEIMQDYLNSLVAFRMEIATSLRRLQQQPAPTPINNPV